MANDQDPLDDGPDPAADTPDDEAEDTAEDDAESGQQNDWTPKDRREATRKVTELGQENARLKRELELARGTSESDEDEDDEEPDESDDALPERLERQNWELAEQVYGKDAVKAYNKVWWPLYEKAETPADFMAALMAFANAVGKGEAPAAAVGGGQSRQEATQPRVDPNRSDGSPDSDDKLAEARKSGKLEDFTSAAAAALGFGPGKRG